MIQLKITSDPLDEIENHLAMVLTYEDVRPLRGQAGMVDWRLNGRLSELILKERFNGQHGEALLMPLQGRLPAKELMVLGMGAHSQLQDQDTPRYVSMILDKLLLKNNRSFSLSFSDLVHGMFEWRNAVRLFMSMLSGREEDYQISIVEPREYVDDARRRHMDFAFDVQVQYR
ncbi:MAG TPA: M17 family peptidase N-terminal domain-containing protein [bacterium]|nr:M17 family peptidase N-terminal domain-containing protein [bacterium]